jgi:hypothetical protein
MRTPAEVTVAFALAWLTLAPATAAQQAPPRATPETGVNGRAFSGRVVDGLGRPVPGVKLTVRSFRKDSQKVTETVLRTGDDGRYAVTLPSDADAGQIRVEKEDYARFSTDISRREIILRRKANWQEASSLPNRDGEKLDLGVRELLASWDFEFPPEDDGKLLCYLFKYQEEFRPALRRLIADAHVGEGARYWLDLLDDSGDRDLFPKGRRYAPDKEVKEADLVEAIKGAVRQRDILTSGPEPRIHIEFIAFTPSLDRAMIQCGVGGGLSGIIWRFVFRKVGKQWELRSVMEVGRA